MVVTARSASVVDEKAVELGAGQSDRTRLGTIHQDKVPTRVVINDVVVENVVRTDRRKFLYTQIGAVDHDIVVHRGVIVGADAAVRRYLDPVAPAVGNRIV